MTPREIVDLAATPRLAGKIMDGGAMPDTSKVRPGRELRRFYSHAEQELETIRYWNKRSISEKLRLTAEVTASAYRQMGIDVHARRSDRSIVRVQCPWC